MDTMSTVVRGEMQPEPARHAPMSFAQERFYFLEQESPGDGYNVAIRLHLTGPLDVSALSRSFIELVARHDILRTRLQYRQGRGLQVIEDVSTFRVEYRSLDVEPCGRHRPVEELCDEESG